MLEELIIIYIDYVNIEEELDQLCTDSFLLDIIQVVSLYQWHSIISL